MSTCVARKYKWRARAETIVAANLIFFVLRCYIVGDGHSMNAYVTRYPKKTEYNRFGLQVMQ